MLIEAIAKPTNMLRFGLKMVLLNDKSSKVMKLKYPLQICLKMKSVLWGSLIYVIFSCSSCEKIWEVILSHQASTLI
jgi:hypothetical protein